MGDIRNNERPENFDSENANDNQKQLNYSATSGAMIGISLLGPVAAIGYVDLRIDQWIEKT